MSDKIMTILANATEGTSYKAHKYGLDHIERPTIEYGEESKESIEWKTMAETVKHKTYIDLSSLSVKLAERGEQLLTYFLDGSRRVFKVDDVAYGDKSRVIYPIVAGQIGVGCCKRVSKKMIPEKFRREFVLSIPSIADSDGRPGFFAATTKKINQSAELQRLHIEFSSILPYTVSKSKEQKFEDLGTACIQDRMLEREKELVADLVREKKLNQDNYLVKDGTLEYRPTKEDRKDANKYKVFKNNYNWVLGVSKGFNPESCVDIHKRPNPGFIADLPLYHRTPVACFTNKDFLGDIEYAVWYIRIRDKAVTRAPFDGVIKVEKILVTQEELANGMNSDLVDQLSAYLINERNPACYGSDLRWAKHLYPVYLTETYIKSKYLSAECFLNLF